MEDIFRNLLQKEKVKGATAVLDTTTNIVERHPVLQELYPIVLYFNVINDGNGRRTWMYVDDVSVNLCSQQARFDPASSRVSVGQNFTVNARLESVSDLYGFETTIRFNPAILEVVDADSGTAGVQVHPGSWLPSSTHIVSNNADNGAGTITFAASLVASVEVDERANPAPLFPLVSTSIRIGVPSFDLVSI